MKRPRRRCGPSGPRSRPRGRRKSPVWLRPRRLCPRKSRCSSKSLWPRSPRPRPASKPSPSWRLSRWLKPSCLRSLWKSSRRSSWSRTWTSWRSPSARSRPRPS
nr:hypothetical protein [Bacillota bacterium]